MAGMDRATGKRLEGWAHVQQSLGDILTTAIGERVERRRYGADVASLLDIPMTPDALLSVFVTVAKAITPRRINGREYGEPRFDLAAIRPRSAGPDGRLVLELVGLYYPRGHLGDVSVFEAARYEVTA